MYNYNNLLSLLSDISKERAPILMSDLIAQHNTTQSDRRHLIVRGDVERDVPHQLKFAQDLHRLKIKGTFYFHTRVSTFIPQLFPSFLELGHEIGYHHECLDRTGGDFAKARDLFLKEVELFRKNDIDLKTVCSHGELGLPMNGYGCNADIFDRYPNLCGEAGIQGEVYRHLGMIPQGYVSDTLRVIHHFFDNCIKFNSKPKNKVLQILVHPHRWRTNSLACGKEVAVDLLQAFMNSLHKRRKYEVVN